MYGFVFTVGQTVDRGDPLDQRESHWYRTFVGILRLMRPSKGIEAVSRAPLLFQCIPQPIEYNTFRATL